MKNDLQNAIILFKDNASDIIPTFMGTETNSGYNNNRHRSYPLYQLKVMICEIKDVDIVEQIITTDKIHIIS